MKPLHKLLLFTAAACLFFLGLPALLLQTSVIESANQVQITAVVAEPNGLSIDTNPSGGVTTSVGGGNNSPDHEEPQGLVNINGYSFPGATIIIYLNGGPLDEVQADEQGFFEMEEWFDEENGQNFTFGAEDENGHSSRTISYGITPEIGGIVELDSVLLPPVFYSSVENGVEGFAIPGALITLQIDGEAHMESVADENGFFEFDLTAVAVSGQEFQVSCFIENQSCGGSQILIHSPAEEEIPGEEVEEVEEVPEEVPTLVPLADINADNRVNYIDFYILREAFLNQNFETRFDLDQNGSLTLADFSLLAYQWSL